MKSTIRAALMKATPQVDKRLSWKPIKSLMEELISSPSNKLVIDIPEGVPFIRFRNSVSVIAKRIGDKHKVRIATLVIDNKIECRVIKGDE